MNSKKKNIPFTQDEKENSIAFILKEVDLRPVTFREFLRSYFQEVGFRYLFWGMGDILFIVGLLLIGVGIHIFPIYIIYLKMTTVMKFILLFLWHLLFAMHSCIF